MRSQEAEHFAAAHRQRKIAYRNLFPKYFAQFQRLNGKAGRLIQVPVREPTGFSSACSPASPHCWNGQIFSVPMVPNNPP
jgi:hypothetical protein